MERQLAPGRVSVRDGIDESLPQIKRKHFVKGRLRHARHHGCPRSPARAGRTGCTGPRAPGPCPARALPAESAHEETRAQLRPQLAATVDPGPGPASREGRAVHSSSGNTRVPSTCLRGSYWTGREAAWEPCQVTSHSSCSPQFPSDIVTEKGFSCVTTRVQADAHNPPRSTRLQTARVLSREMDWARRRHGRAIST